MPNRNQSRQTRSIFLLGAGLVLAHQVAGKAVRDGLFLSQFYASDLPRMMVVAALAAVLLGMGFSRLLSRRGPLRLIPIAFAVSSFLHVGEFALLRIQEESVRAAVITLIYVHLVGFGSILLSGLWSMAGEVFDPRTAKREFGKIAAAGTFGGIFGGLLAERGAAIFGAESLLVLLALLNLATFLALRRVEVSQVGPVEPPDLRDPWNAARAAFRQAPFLLNLASLVLIGTVSATLLDYLFKSGAAATYSRGPQLTRYFALFYTAGQVLSFLAQNFLTPVALRRLGLGRTVQSYPTAVAIGAGASLFLPTVLMAPLARGLELVFRGSFFRSGYELFFTPASPRDKRAIKTFIDVSCDRMGDVVGAGILQLLLLACAQQAVTPILLVTVALACVSFWITRRMDAAYSQALEHGLVNRAVALNEAAVQDSITLSALLHATASFPRHAAPPEPVSRPKIGVQDPVSRTGGRPALRHPRRVEAALSPHQPYDALVVPFAIRLLAWGESFECSRAFLLRHAHRAVGQLVDALLDPEEDFAVRRRIPAILSYTSSQRAVDGLTIALRDPRFEIRFHAGRALEFLRRMTGGLCFDAAALMTAVEREVSSSQSIWYGRTLLDKRDAAGGQPAYLDDVLRDQADKSLEYVFSLLAVFLPAEPLKVAFRALHSQDRMLRGLALEFLESHLSAGLVSQLRRLLDPAPARPTARPAPEVLKELIASQPEMLCAVGEPA